MDRPVPAARMIWDPVVRLFHWTLALAFLLNYAVIEDGGETHERVGYYCLAILSVRVVWGFVGPRNARFSDFFPTPARVRHHVTLLRRGRIEAHEGHNPLGGLMILALMICVALTGLTGWMLELDAFWGEDWAEELHEAMANLTMILVLVHVSAVLLFSWLGPVNLVRTMITGRRKL